jgi:hypothetical protein
MHAAFTQTSDGEMTCLMEHGIADAWWPKKMLT